MTAAAVIGRLLAAGAEQVAVTGLQALAWVAGPLLAAYLLWLPLRWHLRRRREREGTQPVQVDDALDVIGEHGHDLDKEIDDMLRRWGRG